MQRLDGGAAGGGSDQGGQRVRVLLRARLGDDVFTTWFNTLEFDGYDGATVRFSVPVKFLRNWIQSHYAEDLLACAKNEFDGAERVEINLRQPGGLAARQSVMLTDGGTRPSLTGPGKSSDLPDGTPRPAAVIAAPTPALARTQVGGFDHDLRMTILEKRVQEKQALDASFSLGRDVLELLAERLQESGRELEGAVTRLHHTWQYVRMPITLDLAETVIRDLVQGSEPRRIKIEDILRIISRHFGVSKSDLISQRRHRSVVWPRQIGMYLAKQLTARSLPEIGRRFGGRDHTTVLHAIRKIEGELNANNRLRDELDELKKLLNHPM